MKYRKYRYDFRLRFDRLNLNEEVNVKDGNQSDSEDDDSGRALEFEVSSDRVVVGSSDKGKDPDDERKEGGESERKITVNRSKSTENLVL